MSHGAVQLRIGVAILLGVLAAGCYDPALPACRLACNASQCPAGLVCNGQGLCATAEDEVCQPPDDGQQPGEVQVDVRNVDGAPLAGATVVFVDHLGNLVSEVRTSDAGIATAQMAPGGSATVIQEAFTPWRHFWVTTFVDLPPDARLIPQHTSDRGQTRLVTFSWKQDDDASRYEIFTSCGVRQSVKATTLATMVAIPQRCAQFDVVVIAHDTAGDIVGTVELGAQSGPVVTIPDAWQRPPLLHGTIENLPTNPMLIETTIGVSIEPSVPHVPGLSSSMTTMPGSLGEHRLPAGATLVTSAKLTAIGSASAPAQVVISRPAMAANDFTIDLHGKTLPWVEEPMTSLATPSVRWTTIAPAAMTAAEPGLVMATMRYRREDADLSWRLIAPASRIAAVQNQQQELVFPELPGVWPFEPNASDAPLDAEVSLLAADREAITSWRMAAEVVMLDDDPFDVPGLTWATISAARSAVVMGP